MVMSDRVPNCLLASMERLDWFKVMINSDILRRYFGTSSLKMNAEFF